MIYLKKYSKLASIAWILFPIIFILFKRLIKKYHKNLSLINIKYNKIFTVLRHPQDRIVSFYYYYGFNNYISFYEFLKNLKNRNDILSQLIKKNQIEYLKTNTKKSINILNFDNLQQDWFNYCNNNNIEYSKLSIYNKTSKYNTKELYEGVNKKEILNLVQIIYKKDFEVFKYKLKYL